MSSLYLRWRYRKGFQQPMTLTRPVGQTYPRTCADLDALRQAVVEIMQWARDNKFHPDCLEMVVLKKPVVIQVFVSWHRPSFFLAELEKARGPQLALEF